MGEGTALVASAPRRRWSTLGPSLQRRVSRFTLMIAALAVLVTSLGAYEATRMSVVSTVDASLESNARAALVTLGPSPDPATVQRFLASSSELGDDAVTAVVRSDGQVLSSPGGVTLDVDGRDLAVAAGRGGATTHSTTSSTGETYRVLVSPIGPEAGAALLVGRPMAAAQQILRSLTAALAVFGLLALVGAGILGRAVARAGVAPVRELTAEVEQRAVEDDLTPVRVAQADEIGRLAVAFNDLLATVQVSRSRQARFVADAGHELRTPLTSMRTNIELLTADADRAILRPMDRVAIMRDVHAQLLEFSALVSDLIGLTREDRAYAEYEVIDLTAVLEEAIDRVSVLGPGLRWVTQLDSVDLHGDADLLARAFVNVLDNAVRFSPPGGTVSVTLRGREVRISDEGDGVSAEDRPFVFDRFFRSEAARATRGTGLGLSITESVVRQHGGTVAVLEAPGGGALFVLMFPMALSRVTVAGG